MSKWKNHLFGFFAACITQSAGDTAEDVADYVVDIITRVSEAVKDNG